MSGAHQIRADVIPAAHQIAQPLVLHRRHGHERQLSGRQPPRQPDRVALVGLDRSVGARSVRPGAHTAISIPNARARRTSP
jgi:hypothetical protein